MFLNQPNLIIYRTVRLVINSNSNLKIKNRNGEISVHKYQEDMKKDQIVEEAVDLSKMDDMTFSDESESSDDNHSIDGRRSSVLLKDLSKGMSRKSSKKRKSDLIIFLAANIVQDGKKIKNLQEKVEELENKIDFMRSGIKNDMEELLANYMNKESDKSYSG